MSENGGDAPSEMSDVSQAFVRQLEEAGFFRQIQDLEGTLSRVAGDLKVLGESTVRSLQETESLVAHVLALESVVSVLLQSTPVDAEAVKTEVRARTATAASEAGNPKVLAAAEGILARARAEG